MRVLITGATGFIGSHVVRFLTHRGDDVYALVRPGSKRDRLVDVLPELKVIEGDLCNIDAFANDVARADPDVCCHFAWFAEPGLYLSSLENLSMVTSSLQLAMRLPSWGCQRLVVVGTCLEYQLTGLPLSETTPLQPHSLYAASKAALSLMLQELGSLTGVAVTWLRLFYQYGPYEDVRRLVPGVTRSLLHGQPAQISPGEQLRDYLHVQDVAAAIVAVIDAGLTGSVNVGSGNPVTIRLIAETIGQILNCPELVHVGAFPYAPNEPMSVCANVDRLLRSTSWRPTYDLEAGLRQTVDWWRQSGGLG